MKGHDESHAFFVVRKMLYVKCYAKKVMKSVVHPVHVPKNGQMEC